MDKPNKKNKMKKEEYIKVEFSLLIKRKTRRVCTKCKCKRLIENLEPTEILEGRHIKWQCKTKMEQLYHDSKPCFPIKNFW